MCQCIGTPECQCDMCRKSGDVSGAGVWVFFVIAGEFCRHLAKKRHTYGNRIVMKCK